MDLKNSNHMRFIIIMKNSLISESKTFIIAEIGNTHEGNYIYAKKMIIAANKAGADAVKLQHIVPEKFFLNKEQIKKYKKFQLKDFEIKKLIQFAKKKKILLFWTFFDLESFEKYKNDLKLFKISSTDNNFYYFINRVLKEKKPTFISLGLCSYKEIDKLVKHIMKLDKNCYKYVSLLHCNSSYPLKNSEANLSQIQFLKKKYPKFIMGYSDHTIGTDASICAISLGAKVLEKHFTINKKFSKFRDHALSADIQDLRLIVDKSRIICELLKKKKFKNTEQFKNRKNYRRFIFIKNSKKQKKRFNYDDLQFLRYNGKISVEKLEKILKKKIKSK